MNLDDHRIEHDSMGEVRVPAHALYGAQTQRAVDNFRLSGLTMPRPFIRALALIKEAIAEVHGRLGLLDAGLASAIQAAAVEVAEGRHDAHFPVDVFQTGSGTSSNMNANEVIAHLAAARLGRSVHPNDEVNKGQSSNDVIPAAIRLSALLEVRNALLPALEALEASIGSRARELAEVVKTGRTHLMDALPLTFGQELSGWQSQISQGRARLQDALARLNKLPLGGTAVGTGVNAHPELGRRAVARLSTTTGLALEVAGNLFEGISAQDAAVELSGQLRTVAVSLSKIANDLRLMNSGPLAGLGEINLPALQPGSSIMPGKVNPVVPEAVAMACAQVLGNDLAIALGGQGGSFQLNVMLPLIAYNLLQSIRLLSGAARLLAGGAVQGFTVNTDRLQAALARNPMLVTALNESIGYEQGARIAKRASEEGRPVLEVALAMTDLPAEELARLLDPLRLARGGR
jgi:fumarate hydratase class II